MRDEGSPSPSDRWWEPAVRTVREFDRQNLSIIAGGLAFFALLGGFPLLFAIVSLYGLAFDPTDVKTQLAASGEFLPDAVQTVVADQLGEIVQTSSGELSLSAVASIAASIWAGSRGVFYLFRSLNVAYGERETRGYIRLKVTTFAFTVGAILFAVVAIALLAIAPAVLRLIGLAEAQERLFSLARWPVLGASILAGIGLLYRFGPDHKRRVPSWITAGSLMVTTLWIALSLLFSSLVEIFVKGNETSGSLGTVIAVLVWLYLTALLVLAGAVVNAQVFQRR